MCYLIQSVFEFISTLTASDISTVGISRLLLLCLLRPSITVRHNGPDQLLLAISRKMSMSMLVRSCLKLCFKLTLQLQSSLVLMPDSD